MARAAVEETAEGGVGQGWEEEFGAVIGCRAGRGSENRHRIDICTNDTVLCSQKHEAKEVTSDTAWMGWKMVSKGRVVDDEG